MDGWIKVVGQCFGWFGGFPNKNNFDPITLVCKQATATCIFISHKQMEAKPHQCKSI
jgi:hypothetical protein